MYSLTPRATIIALGNLTRRSLLLCGILLTPIAWFVLSAETQAVTPAADGGYPGNNTAEGTNALLTLTTGSSNTAIGVQDLGSDTTGSSNTSLGLQAHFRKLDII